MASSSQLPSAVDEREKAHVEIQSYDRGVLVVAVGVPEGGVEVLEDIGRPTQ